MTEKFTARVSVHVFLQREGKILLLRRFNTGYEDGKYSVPAGHIDGNEIVRAALAREAKEEVGVDVAIEDLAFAHVMHRKRAVPGEYIDFFFTADKWKREVKNMEPNKCDELEWFRLDSLPNNIVPYVKQALELSQKSVLYSESGW